MSVHLSGCISVFPTGQISMKFGTGDSHKITRGTPDLVKIAQEYHALSLKT